MQLPLPARPPVLHPIVSHVTSPSGRQFKHLAPAPPPAVWGPALRCQVSLVSTVIRGASSGRQRGTRLHCVADRVLRVDNGGAVTSQLSAAAVAPASSVAASTPLGQCAAVAAGATQWLCRVAGRLQRQWQQSRCQTAGLSDRRDAYNTLSILKPNSSKAITRGSALSSLNQIWCSSQVQQQLLCAWCTCLRLLSDPCCQYDLCALIIGRG
jgi:hypothetical protein